MTTKDLLQKCKVELEGLLNFYKNDIASIHTGRANPGMVENLIVDCYGQKMRIKELASITAPEPRTVAIQPWDKAAVEPISSAIRNSDLGLNPVVDGNVIRLNVPPLTEERRKEFIKLLKQKTEDARIKIRKAREEVWDKMQKMGKSGEIREDDKFRGKEDLQKLVDEYNKKTEDFEKNKERDLTFLTSLCA